MNDSIQQELLDRQALFFEELNQIQSLKDLEICRVAALGKKGWVKKTFELVKQASQDERKKIAQQLNELKKNVEG